ncbi:MAG: 23S rRNA (guanosine(2251)-2'-O)-methyltransferase RlmB, partial [Gammaproteobacteria bacterium]|nr:23S rRNA (guanosine(2251)-2'-O)-methyltransferase RlmB [Gammaproteobacteria bacterium]
MTRVLGIHSVRQALMAGLGQKLILRQGSLNDRQRELLDLAVEKGIPVVRETFDAQATATQGAALETVSVGFRTEKELEVLLRESRDAWLFLVLDGVTDPRNFGACVRSAAGFGADALIVPKDHSAPMNDAAVKTASGAASIVPVFQVVNLARTLNKLKQAGVWTVGTVLDGDAELLQDIDLKGSVALVMGSEDRGIRQKTRQSCDFLAEIPTSLPDLSLNVSVATGICLYEICRQRG